MVCDGPSECCHVRGKRMWGDIGNCFPCCTYHHIEEQHRHGILTFQQIHGLDLRQIAAAYGEAWEQAKAPPVAAGP